MVYKSFCKNSKGAGIKNEIKETKGEFHSQLANELHRPINRMFKKENYILLSKIVFEVLIWLICS